MFLFRAIFSWSATGARCGTTGSASPFGFRARRATCALARALTKIRCHSGGTYEHIPYARDILAAAVFTATLRAIVHRTLYREDFPTFLTTIIVLRHGFSLLDLLALFRRSLTLENLFETLFPGFLAFLASLGLYLLDIELTLHQGGNIVDHDHGHQDK